MTTMNNHFAHIQPTHLCTCSVPTEQCNVWWLEVEGSQPLLNKSTSISLYHTTTILEFLFYMNTAHKGYLIVK